MSLRVCVQRSTDFRSQRPAKVRDHAYACLPAACSHEAHTEQRSRLRRGWLWVGNWKKRPDFAARLRRHLQPAWLRLELPHGLVSRQAPRRLGTFCATALIRDTVIPYFPALAHVAERGNPMNF